MNIRTKISEAYTRALASDFSRRRGNDYLNIVLTSVVLATFIVMIFGLRVIQEQQALIIAYQEDIRVNANTMYCVYTPDTLTTK